MSHSLQCNSKNDVNDVYDCFIQKLILLVLKANAIVFDKF